MLTEGGELFTTFRVTVGDVVVMPKLSDATAVRTWEPAAKVVERSNGLEDTLPKEVVPSKNCTLVTLPSLSLAAAWIVTVVGPIKVVPSMGFAMLTEGGKSLMTLIVTGAEVLVAPRLSEATAVRECEPKAGEIDS